MKLTDIDFDDKRSWIKITDLENFFSIYQDKRQNYCYNLNEAVYFDFGDDVFDTYTCEMDMFWPLISYKLYGTTRLAWFLQNINRVKASQMFSKCVAGTQVYYVPKKYIKTIVENLNTFDN